MLSWCWSIVTLVILIGSYSDALLTCNGGVFSNYALTPLPVNPLTGDDITNLDGCFESSLVMGRRTLICSTNPLLIDGDMGPVDNYTSAGVLAWNRSSQSVNIRYRFAGDDIQIRHFSFFFYNSPSAGIGLPDIAILLNGIVQDYFITGNEELSQTDNNRRQNVTLSLASPEPDNSFTIEFTFAEDSNVNWLILSELKLCHGPTTVLTPMVPPSIVVPVPLITKDANNVSPNVNLICSVSGEGMFIWEWTGPGGTSPSNVQLYDLTRTSNATFTGIRRSDESFRCMATYSSVIPSLSSEDMSAFQDITVELQSTILSLNESSVSAALSEEVTLACEIFGYFGTNIPSIAWSRNNIDIMDDDPFYSITTEDGTRLIQNGGESAIPSVISILHIFVNDSSVFAQYLCIETRARSITLTDSAVVTSTTAVTTRSTSDTSDTSFPPSPSSAPSVLSPTVIAIIGSMIGALVFLIVFVLIIIIVIRRKQSVKRINLATTRRKDSLDYEGEPFYQEVPKPAPPPIPDRFPNLNSDIEAYATIDNIREHNGHLRMNELGNRNEKQPQTAVRSSMIKTDNSANDIAGHLKFLERNPLYCSSDNIDSDMKMTNRSGSIPSLDILTDSPHGSQLNIYAKPSRAAPPVPTRDFRSMTPEDAIYSEPDLNPTVFHSRSPPPLPIVSSVPLPSEEDSLPCFSIYADPQPLLRMEGPKEIKPGNIREEKNLGFGQFGKVLLAETIGLSLKDLRLDKSNTNTNISVQVAVKKLKPSPENHIKEAFEKEIKFMSRLHNDNVVRLLAICSTGDPFIVMEYMENGDLNQFLQKRKLAAVESSPSKKELTRSQLAFISLQIASGMKYLATFNFIHRDLATRNCLVGSNLVVKIADFGMSRSLYSCSYYRISGRAMLPIRWMANECFYGKFSEKTDIWAFGVTMWEVFNFARGQPYHEMSDQEVIDDAIKGPDRMVPNKPAACPSEVYKIMNSCWIDDTNERASFEQVHSALESVYNFNTNFQTE